MPGLGVGVRFASLPCPAQSHPSIWSRSFLTIIQVLLLLAESVTEARTCKINQINPERKKVFNRLNKLSSLPTETETWVRTVLFEEQCISCKCVWETKLLLKTLFKCDRALKQRAVRWAGVRILCKPCPLVENIFPAAQWGALINTEHVLTCSTL